MIACDGQFAVVNSRYAPVAVPNALAETMYEPVAPPAYAPAEHWSVGAPNAGKFGAMNGGSFATTVRSVLFSAGNVRLTLTGVEVPAAGWLIEIPSVGLNGNRLQFTTL